MTMIIFHISKSFLYVKPIITQLILPYSLSYLLIYLLTPWSCVLPEKRTGSHLVKKFPAFFVTRRFIITFTKARHPSLSWANSIQSIPPHPTSWRSILILSSNLNLDLQSGLFPSVFPPKPFIQLYSPICATCPAHQILDLITRTILDDQYRSFGSSLCSFLHSLVTSNQWQNTIQNFYYSDLTGNIEIKGSQLRKIEILGRNLNGTSTTAYWRQRL